MIFSLGEVSILVDHLDFHMLGTAMEFHKPNMTMKVQNTFINNFSNNQNNMELPDKCSSVNIFLQNRNLC